MVIDCLCRSFSSISLNHFRKKKKKNCNQSKDLHLPSNSTMKHEHRTVGINKINNNNRSSETYNVNKPNALRQVEIQIEIHDIVSVNRWPKQIEYYFLFIIFVVGFGFDDAFKRQ